jgi:hypothetical protein
MEDVIEIRIGYWMSVQRAKENAMHKTEIEYKIGFFQVSCLHLIGRTMQIFRHLPEAAIVLYDDRQQQQQQQVINCNELCFVA